MYCGSRQLRSSLALALVIGFAGGGPSVAAPRRDKAVASPRAIALSARPTSVALHGADALQQVVVTGRYSDGFFRDLTHAGRFSVGNPRVARIESGRIVPVGDGETNIWVRDPSGGPAARIVVKVTGADLVREPSFTHEVVPLINQQGCASGTCHGSFSGRGGLRVSLFGYDPERDFRALTRDAGGRRVNPTAPETSLVLRKPALQMPHGGGQRFQPGSRPYDLLARWIAAGARWDRNEAALESLEIYPRDRVVLKGKGQQFLVRARYADGSEQDVTRLCKFKVTDDDVATIDARGVVTTSNPGDTAVLAEFLGEIVSARIYVPANRDLIRNYPPQEQRNFVDELVQKKLRKLGLLPSPLCGDGEFLRRVSLDLCGMLPSPDEIRAFVANKSADKRARKIDELLDRPQYAEFWATKLCDWTGNDNRFTPTTPRRETSSHRWYRWFYARFRAHDPWDQIMRGLVTATSREGRSAGEWLKEVQADYQKRQAKGEASFDASDYEARKTLDIFYMKSGNNASAVARQISYVFLGVQVECAECHKHPFDRWSQSDFTAFQNIFRAVRSGISASTKSELKGQDLKIGSIALREVYIDSKRLAQPMRGLGAEDIPKEAGADPRMALADWIASPDNPFFGRAIANRIWTHHLGHGIVDPPDQFSQANPPSNPELLDALGQDFVEHGFDLRRLHRVILNSRTYQTTWRANATNAGDLANASHYQVKRLSAEVLLDAINHVTDATENWSGRYAPAGSRAIAVGPSRIGGDVGYVLQTFGRPTRTQSCDCERGMAPALPQALYLINDEHVQKKLAAKKGRVAQLLAKGKSDAAIVEEAYLWGLSRFPTERESKRALKHLTRSDERQQNLEDLLWALINSREFFTNH